MVPSLPIGKLNDLEKRINSLETTPSVTAGQGLNLSGSTMSRYSDLTDKTSDYTLALTDAWDVLTATTTSSVKFTVPPNSSVAFDIGTRIDFYATDTGLVYFEAGSGVTIVSANSYLGITPETGRATITKIGTNTWHLEGDLKLALDADAEAYINAVGGLSETTQGYINTWFLSAKANGYYNSLHAVYLFIGGDAASHKWNAVDPQDTDAAFRLTFTGSPTHDSNGVTFNGSSQYANTHLKPGTVLGQNDKSMSGYLRSVGAGGSSWGAVDNAYVAADFLLINAAGTCYFQLSGSGTSVASPATKTGFWLENRTSSTSADLRRNDTSLKTEGTSAYNINLDVYLGCRNKNGTAIEYNADNICFWACGDGLSSAEATAMYNDCVTLQTSLGRNV